MVEIQRYSTILTSKQMCLNISFHQVRCLTLCQFDKAEVSISEDGSLYHVLNVTETKRKESSLTLTHRRKQQVQKFISDIRSLLIGDEKAKYVFGQEGGEKMVSILLFTLS